MPLEQVSRLLIVGGLIIVAVGLLLLLGSRVPFVGRLPGEFFWQREGISVYVPLATSLLVSVALSVLLTLVFRMTGRGE
jgi:membrane protein implicated in regulation of membrane protease activity